jgi:hypothetical protein
MGPPGGVGKIDCCKNRLGNRGRHGESFQGKGRFYLRSRKSPGWPCSGRAGLTLNDDRAGMNDDYDTPWKDALTRYFPEFMAFYFPQAYAQIDWTVPHAFLEQELAQVVGDGEVGPRRVDKLVRVARHGGRENWVFVHIDVQGKLDRGFAERVFVYNYRIYDRYRRPVASLVVLADGSGNWRPSAFNYSLLGCETGIRFPSVKLTDYAARLDQLLHEQNVFGLVTAAHLLTQQTRGQHVERYAAKWRLTRLLYERNSNK